MNARWYEPLFAVYPSSRGHPLPAPVRHRPALEALEHRDVPSTISGMVFNDLNRDGVYQTDEPGLANCLVTVDYNPSDSTHIYTHTAADGTYSIAGIQAGTHVVNEMVREPAYAYTLPSDGTRTVSVDGTTDLQGLDFGNYLTPQGPIGLDLLLNPTTAGAQSLNEGNGPGRHTVASDALGNFVVVWSGNGPGDADGVFVQRYQADGTRVGGEVRVNVTTTGAQRIASVAMDAAGNFVVVWMSPNNRTPTTGYGEVRARLFSSSGTPRSGELLIQSNGFVHDVAMDATGNFVIAYETSSGVKETLYAQRYNAAGVAQGKAISFGVQLYSGDNANLAMDRDGDFVIVWSHTFQRVDRLGRKQGPAVPLPEAIKPSVGMDGAGNFVIAWYVTTTSPMTMVAQRYNAAGTPQGSVFAPAAGFAQGYPAVAMDANGAFAIAWQGGRHYQNIFVRRFTAEGVGDQPVVANQPTVHDGSVKWPSVTMAGGHLTVVWTGPGNSPGDSSDVYGRLYPYPAGGAVAAQAAVKMDDTGGGATLLVLPDALVSPQAQKADSREQRPDQPTEQVALPPDLSTPLDGREGVTLARTSGSATRPGGSSPAAGEDEPSEVIDALFSLSPLTSLLLRA